MSRNAEVADLLDEMADRLEALDVAYKPRAYRRAADNIRASPVAVEGLAGRGSEAVEEIEGVGDAIAAKVVEFVETGEIEELEELRAELPADIVALTSVEGVGPKTVGTLYEELGIVDLDDLEAAAEAGEIREVSGFGAKTEENILDGIAFARESHQRTLLGDARPLADRLLADLGDVEGVERIEPAGSMRRWRPTVGDIDLLVAAEESQPVVDAFTEWAGATEVIEAGTGKASIRSNGFRVDLRVVVPSEYGAALQYFTGSKAHNLSLRTRAIERGVKLNEYGAFDVSDVPEGEDGQRVGTRIGGETEAEMYEAVDLPLIPPEMREDRGEIAAAAEDRLPELISEDDIRGDLHTHSSWSDGRNSVAEMAARAAAFGHDYLAITDHATGPGMVGGVGVEDEALLELAAEVREVNEDADVTLFSGVEANIDVDGNVSVDDDVLAELDVVVASPHSGLDGDGTDRLVAAVEHPHVNVIGHPTGRLLNRRPGFDVDVEAVATAAADHDVALEINADPARLDLDGFAVKTAIEAGATIVVDTDAHSPGGFENVRYGVHTARRGWATADDVLNAWETDRVREFLDR